jgi:hypothetical protein
MEHPTEFERALPEYGRQDALVFDGIDYFGVWTCLMFRRWSHLATYVVQLDGAPHRTREQVIAMLKERVQPIVAAVPASESSLAAGT